MKNLIIFILFFALSFQFACSMGSKHNQERDITRTFFWASDKVGVFYTQSCDITENKVCIKWRKKELDVIKDWDFIKNSRLILVNESIFFDLR